MDTVGELDDNDAKIFCHSEDEASPVLRFSFAGLHRRQMLDFG